MNDEITRTKIGFVRRLGHDTYHFPIGSQPLPPIVLKTVFMLNIRGIPQI